MSELPESSRFVVIGGGIVGCSTAYHLAALGCETLLLERHQLTSGSTWHAAGLIGQLRSSAGITQLLGDSVSLYRNLEQQTGLSTGWKMNGGLRLACNADRWIEVKRQATTATSFGLDMQLLTPVEARELWPLMQIDDVVGAAFLPTDGQANPTDITRALAAGARQQGALVLEGIAVNNIRLHDGVIAGVETSDGFVACEKVICCCGQWSRQVAATVGVTVPLVSVQHQYIVTDQIDGVTPELPTLRDPDRLTYFKEEVGGLVMGGYEPNPKAWATDGVPEDFSFSLLDNDIDHFAPMLEFASGRVPALENAGIKQMINGPESFTPDGNFILGEAPELAGFFVGAGFNAFGIASGGGAGMALAEWAAHGAPPYDLWPVDIRRFGQPHADTHWVRQRTLEAYSRHYTMAWPYEENKSARPARTSPLYPLLKTRGACFGEKLGWERPNWFASVAAGESPDETYTFGKPGWFNAVRREHLAARNAAVLIDQTSFAKFLLCGKDATRAMDWIAANDTDVAVGKVVYTQLLNDNGGIEADVVVSKIDPTSYYIVTGTGFATRDFHWISSNLPAELDCTLIDVTSEWSVLSLMGPQAQAILAALPGYATDDFSSTRFPFATLQELTIAGALVKAIRLSYLGGPGWELHVPVESAVAVYEMLHRVGEAHGLLDAGYRCIESCRLEVFHRAWGSDISPTTNPFEAGLDWAVKLGRSDKPFKGRESLSDLRRMLESGKPVVKRQLANFVVDDADVQLFGRETIYRNNKQVGWLTSGGYGHSINRPIGIGYVRMDAMEDKRGLLNGDYSLNVAGDRVACRISLQPLLKFE